MNIDLGTPPLNELLKEVELEYTNTYCRVVLLKDLPRLEVAGITMENLKQGNIIQLRKWAADKLVEIGVAKWAELTIDLNYLSQLLWKEKNNITELQEVPKYFYMEVKKLIDEVSKTSKDKAEEIRRRLMDITSLRLLKLFSYAAKRIRPATTNRMTPEESILFELVMKLVNEWVSHVCPKESVEV
ncbi:MAG: hypothetical protein RMJ14_05935 [Nitrososphaerota archaeon]|nr:DNA replication complex GINS family protein [Aigarchaeota archaeon]MDW8077153.1 hypothetical protein [Nitrososphaerota archaeon]